MGYVYRGTIRDTKEQPTVRKRPGVFDPAKCGTYAGYKQHQRYGVMPACRECLDAQTAYTRGYVARRRTEGVAA